MSTLADTGGAEGVDPGILTFLERSGLVGPDEQWSIAPLTGGVASDIWKVTAGERTFVVKKALATLRVAQEWKAPVSRNASEVEWMIEAAKVAPSAVPQVLAHDAALGAFAMTYFQPQDYPVWKEELRHGRVDAAFAARLGATMAAIHSATAGSAEVARRFANDGVFHAIRLAPYLEATATVHPDLAPQLMAMSDDVLHTHRALVHGDISPKNILVGPGGPVILDAECAWYGDPSFDFAFCLNHLMLKCVERRASTPDYLAAFDALAAAYLAAVDWEPAAGLEARAARLLPALFLARVDGKSPVEYITSDGDKALVRGFAPDFIATPRKTLAEIRQGWARELAQ